MKSRLGTTRDFNGGCVNVVEGEWHGCGCGQVDGRIDNDGVIVAHGALKVLMLIFVGSKWLYAQVACCVCCLLGVVMVHQWRSWSPTEVRVGSEQMVAAEGFRCCY